VAGVIAPSGFRPAWWLPGAHLQTLYPHLLRRPRPPAVERERVELPDGDFVDLDWAPQTGRPGELVLLLHGLEGSIRSHYAAGLLSALHAAGMNAVLMHFRGCSGEPNRLPRAYHSGDTGDLDHVARLLLRRSGVTGLCVAGVSLGGNVLLKWLGEQGAAAPVRRAAAVSVPFDLANAARRMERGLSRLYQAWLLGRLRASLRAKAQRMALPVAIDRLDRLTTFRAFDDAVTAPLHGFAGVDDYYRRSSSRPFLARIAVPTLILHARDDPFMTPDAIPREDELAPPVTLELSTHGGHVGFVAGRLPGRPQYWAEQRLCRFLRDAS